MQKIARMSIRPKYQEGLLVFLTIVTIGAFYFYNLAGSLINDDEGSFLYQIWRSSEGDRPYTDFSTSRWPLFLYTGSALVKVFGRSIWALRAVCALLTLGSAFLVFVLARRLLSPGGAWLAMVVFLLHPQVFYQGRLFYPEPFMLFFSILGLYSFDRGWRRRELGRLIVAGLCFAVALLYKPLAVLSFGGCLLWALYAVWRRRTNWRAWMIPFVAFTSSFGLLIGLFLVGSYLFWGADFYASFMSTHVPSGQKPGWSQYIANYLTFSMRYSLRYFSLLVFALPAVWVHRQKRGNGAWLACQVLSALAFLFSPRTLYDRHLFYLTPTLAIFFALALEPLSRWRGRSFLLVAVIGAVLVPWTMEHAAMAMQSESDTMQLVDIIRAQIGPDARLLADYQELNFYAGCQSTYLGAEISQVVVENGKITSEKLISEIEREQVEMIVIDVSPETGHHLITLPDYEEFVSRIESDFTLLGQFPRGRQRLDVYIRDIP